MTDILGRNLGGFDVPANDTIHFNVGNVGAPAVAPTPGVADAAAMSVFGQLNIATQRRIAFWHLHVLLGGTGTLTVELWRSRNGVLTLLDSNSIVNPTDFDTVTSVPSSPILLSGDYLFAQATDASAISGGADGLTIDIHFAPPY